MPAPPLRLGFCMTGSFCTFQRAFEQMERCAAAGYEILKREGYPEEIQKMVLHHHENMDGSGYPDNLSGEKIPLGARIIRVCDVYAALLSDRPYRKGFDQDTAIQLMIEEIKNFDMKIFLTFQRVIHEENNMEIILPPIEI